MLAHSPDLPLIVDYCDQGRHVTPQDAANILLVLQRHQHQVYSIRIRMPIPDIQNLVEAFDGEFPMLEYLLIERLTNEGQGLVLPETFKATRLRHFSLNNIPHCPDLSHPLPYPASIGATEELFQVASNSESRLRDRRCDPFSTFISLCTNMTCGKQITQDIHL
jgi:hypothetical protein